jgi:cytochrome c oxidase cbb3-type subunit III
MNQSQSNQKPEQRHEEDLLLNHEYDGILEYDNPLPGWWIWLFIGSIIFCLPYVMWYHLGQGASVLEKYEHELAAYNEALLQQFGLLEGDQATLLKHMEDQVALASMAPLFKGKCAQCHRADGSGDIGPNLTDESWIHGKLITDIPPIIQQGVLDKGMPAWASKLSQTEIVLLSSYVAALRNHPIVPPAGKEAQGTPIEPWPTQETVLDASSE